MTLVPLASWLRKSSTFETVRLKATTVKPWSFMLRMRFWPMTARPMSAMSALGSIMFLTVQLETRVVFQHRFQVGPSGLVHFIESVEINSDGVGRMFGEQGVHGVAEFGVLHRRRQILDDSFLVRDAKGVE